MPESSPARPSISGATIRTAQGGTLRVPDDKTVTTPTQVAVGDYGVAFDGLELTAYPQSTAVLAGLTFGTPDDGGGWFGGGGGGGWFSLLPLAAARPGWAGADDDSPLTRRDLLRVAAGATASSGLMVAASAAETVTKAHVQLAANPGGVRVRVLDRGAAPLELGASYGLTAQQIKYDEFNAGAGAYGDLPPTLTGQIGVTQDVSALAFFKALSGAKAVQYSGLQLPKNPADVSTGTKLTITDHDILVRHAQKASGDDATLSIGGTSIPAYTESQSSPVGWWGVRDDAIIYEVGPKPPASTDVTFTLYAGTITETTDDAGRVI